MTKKSALEAAREAMGFNIRRVAEVLQLDISGYTRIERGAAMPQRATGRRIAKFFGADVPLGMIFDPCNEAYDDWLTESTKRKLRARARELIEEHPELELGDRRKQRLDDRPGRQARRLA